MSEEIPEPIAKFLETLDFQLPDKPKLSEAVTEQPRDDSEIMGSVLKISFTVRMFMNHEKLKYYMITSDQRMLNEGEMSLKDAMAKFNRKRRK